MQYDMKITAAQVAELLWWVAPGPGGDPTEVELAADDRMLIAESRGDRMAWDLDGSPASDEYLKLAPWDPTGEGRYAEVFVVVNDYDASDPPAVFRRQQDAESYAATFTEALTVERCTIADAELTKAMVADRREDDDDEESPTLAHRAIGEWVRAQDEIPLAKEDAAVILLYDMGVRTADEIGEEERAALRDQELSL